MPRKPIARSNDYFYVIRSRSNDREAFYLAPEEMWEILTRHLKNLQIEFGLRIDFFLVLPNEFHVVILSPKEKIDRIIYFLMKRSALTIQKRTGRINKVFGSKGKACLLLQDSQKTIVVKYLSRLPVERGLSVLPEDYQYSSLKKNDGIFEPAKRNLSWIGTPFSREESESIACGLKKTVFAYKKRGAYGPVVPL